MRKENFAVGQRVRLKWELEPPMNIPAGAIGEVTRVSPWDVWVRFEKRVVRLPFSEVEQEGLPLIANGALHECRHTVRPLNDRDIHERYSGENRVTRKSHSV